MHEVAILANDAPALGKKAGSLISIDQLETTYKTSAAAKANKYKCANEHCNVNVIAVIPQKNKPGRKKSPCAYFSAKPISHIKGCSRQPLGSGVKESTQKPTTEPNPTRRTAPTVWVDPEIPSEAKGGDGKSDSPQNVTGDSSRSSRADRQGGTSEARSQLVRRFAVEWKLMSLHERQNTPLNAPWNKGGSYFSAFFPIRYYQKSNIIARGESIFAGELFSIYKGTTGYTLTLKEKDSSGLELKIWIQNITFDKGKSGETLKDELIEIANNPKAHEGREIYVFGKFIKQHSSNTGSRSWLSLPIVHPSMIWIRSVT